MKFLESVWARFGGERQPAAGPVASPVVADGSARRRIAGVAVRCLDTLGGVFADPERVRWVLLQPEVDGAVRKFSSLAALGDTRAEEALEARAKLEQLLAAELPGESSEHVEMLLDLVHQDACGPARQPARPPVAREPEPAVAAGEPDGDPDADDPFAPLLEAEAVQADRRASAARPEAGVAVPAEYELSVVPCTSLADVDPSLVREYVQAATRRRPSSALTGLRDAEALLALRALEGRPGKERLTVLGGLFFARRPERIVVQSRVRFVEFAGTEVASNGDAVAYRYSEEVTGTIPQLIARVERLHRERLAPGVLTDGFRLEEQPAVPLFALREAIVNAVCHRDYSLVGANVQIRLFDDRLEVQSPGGLPGPVTLENIVSESYARNPRLADMLRDLGYVERHGLGIDNMVKAMETAHLPAPEFTNGESSFTVTLRFRHADEAAPEAWLAAIGARFLTPGHQKALVLTRRAGRIGVAAYRSLNAVPEAEAERELRDLVRDGWLEKEGAGGTACYRLGPAAGARPRAAAEGHVPPIVLGSLPKSQRRVLDIVARLGSAKAGEVLDISGLKDRRSIQRALGALTERGLLVRCASSATDPNASYELSGTLGEEEAPSAG